NSGLAPRAARAPSIFGSGASSPPMASSAIRMAGYFLRQLFRGLNQSSTLVIAAFRTDHMAWRRGLTLGTTDQLNRLDRVMAATFTRADSGMSPLGNGHDQNFSSES